MAHGDNSVEKMKDFSHSSLHCIIDEAMKRYIIISNHVNIGNHLAHFVSKYVFNGIVFWLCPHGNNLLTPNFDVFSSLDPKKLPQCERPVFLFTSDLSI